MILLSKIIRNFRDYGAGVFLQKSFLNIIKPIFVQWTYLLYVVDLQKFTIRQPTASSRIVFRFIDAEENAIIKQIEDMEEWLQGKITTKLRRGQKCLIALQNINKETVVGFNLLGFSRFDIPLIRLSKSLRQGECFSEQITVHHKFRGKGLGTDLRHAVFAAMKESGYRRIYGGTQTTNKANKALTRKVGFKEFALATYTRVCWYQSLKISRVHKV